MQMASQPVASSGGDLVELSSFVRGVHAYKDLWEDVISGRCWYYELGRVTVSAHLTFVVFTVRIITLCYSTE